MPVSHSRRRLNSALAALPGAAAATPLLGASASASAQAGNVIVMATDQSPRHFNSAVQSGVATFLPSALKRGGPEGMGSFARASSSAMRI